MWEMNSYMLVWHGPHAHTQLPVCSDNFDCLWAADTVVSVLCTLETVTPRLLPHTSSCFTVTGKKPKKIAVSFTLPQHACVSNTPPCPPCELTVPPVLCSRPETTPLPQLRLPFTYILRPGSSSGCNFEPAFSSLIEFLHQCKVIV